MKTFFASIKVAAVLVLALVAFTGCESTDGGSTHTSVYYGVGYGDPWYHGDYDYNYDIDVTPPPRPGDGGLRPSHPIARPPSAGVSPRPTPMPSIPSMPRPSPRMGGGGGGKRR